MLVDVLFRIMFGIHNVDSLFTRANDSDVCLYVNLRMIMFDARVV